MSPSASARLAGDRTQGAGDREPPLGRPGARARERGRDQRRAGATGSPRRGQPTARERRPMSTPARPAPHPLVETKLHAPRRRRGVVHRARLANRLLPPEQPPLTLVSAPAGFGKTTLLTEWFADRGRTTAWLSLDAGDNDAARFWSYLIAALRTVVPDVGRWWPPTDRSDGGGRGRHRRSSARIRRPPPFSDPATGAGPTTGSADPFVRDHPRHPERDLSTGRRRERVPAKQFVWRRTVFAGRPVG